MLGQAFSCYLNLLGGGRGLTKVHASLKEVQKVIDLADRSQPNHREKLYVDALKCLAKGYAKVWFQILLFSPSNNDIITL